MTSKILTFFGILLLLSCDDCAGTSSDPIDQTRGTVMVQTSEDDTWARQDASRKADTWYIWVTSNEYVEMEPRGGLVENEYYAAWRLGTDDEDQLKLLFEGDYSDIANMEPMPAKLTPSEKRKVKKEEKEEELKRSDSW